jgi:hypothetical protein
MPSKGQEDAPGREQRIPSEDADECNLVLGMTTPEASSGGDALILLAKSILYFVIIDISLPDSSGLYLA